MKMARFALIALALALWGYLNVTGSLPEVITVAYCQDCRMIDNF